MARLEVAGRGPGGKSKEDLAAKKESQLVKREENAKGERILTWEDDWLRPPPKRTSPSQRNRTTDARCNRWKASGGYPAAAVMTSIKCALASLGRQDAVSPRRLKSPRHT